MPACDASSVGSLASGPAFDPSSVVAVVCEPACDASSVGSLASGPAFDPSSVVSLGVALVCEPAFDPKSVGSVGRCQRGVDSVRRRIRHRLSGGVRVSVPVPVNLPDHVLVADTRARARTRPSVLE
jgi:hypothetical protein